MAYYRLNNTVLGYKDLPCRGYGTPVFPSSGLLCYYRFENNGIDAVGNYNATETSMSYTNTDAIKLYHGTWGSSSTGYLTVLNDGYGVFNLTEYSISTWIRFTSLDGYKIIWSYDYTSHNPPYYAQELRIDYGTYRTISFIVGTAAVRTPAIVNINTWYNIVATTSLAAKQTFIYVNGELKGSNYNYPLTAPTFYHQEVWIGKSNFATNLNCYQDETGFWNRALSAEEALLIYNGGAGTFY